MAREIAYAVCLDQKIRDEYYADMKMQLDDVRMRMPN
jgi:hypothetical protein